MIHNHLKVLLVVFMFVSGFVTTHVIAAEKNRLTIYQVMQRVFERYPSLKISELQVSQAAEQRKQIESQLGWVLNSTAGVSHDLTGLGTPSDSFDVNGTLSRTLKSGSSLSLSGGYRYEDSSLAFSPLLPNPAQTTKLDLNYRIPLAQGNENLLYQEGLISADSGLELAKANQTITRINLAEQVKNIFYSLSSTHAKLVNASDAVTRAKKLEKFIYQNFKLGLAEEKDRLQVKAQLRSKLAELSALELVWQQQKTVINRLMLEEWQSEFQPVFTSHKNREYDLNHTLHQVKMFHPSLRISQAQIEIADSKIDSARDSKKDNFDLVLSVGARTSDGDNATTSVSERDWAGAVRFEYQHLFDDKGVSSKYKQAQLEKNIALQELKIANDDIEYTTSGLISEIKVAKLAVETAKQKLESESNKLKEALQRIRIGRADTDQFIQFQNEFSFAELSYQIQKLELSNRIIALQIYSGELWSEFDNITERKAANLQGVSP